MMKKNKFRILIIDVIFVMCISLTALLNAETRKLTRHADVIRKEKVSERKGLPRHRLNQELAHNRVPGVEADLIRSLHEDESAVVRQGAAQMLGNYVQSADVVRHLADALENESDPSVRYACALSLGLSKTFRAMKALEKFCDDPDPNLRRQIAFSLKLQKNARAKFLLKKLAKDADQSVREMAASNLNE